AERSTGTGDRDLALNLWLGAALRCWWADTGPAARARVARVAHLVTRVEDDPRYVAVLGVAEPLAQAGPVTAQLSRIAVDDLADADALRLLGMAAHAVGDEVRAAVLLDRAEAVLRDQGRLGLLPAVLAMQARARTELGDWGAAAAAATEGQRLAQETGQPIWGTATLVCAARLHGLRGEVDHAVDLAAEAELVA